LWGDGGKEEVRKGILGALLKNGSVDVVKAIAMRDLNEDVADQEKEIEKPESERRIEIVREILGDGAQHRVKAILSA
jgi:hypothetical protein